LFLQAEALVHEFTPQEIANLLWAYAKLGMKPPHMLLVALWESVGGSSSATASSGSSSSSLTSSAFATPLSAAAAADGLGSSSSSSGGVTARLSAFKPGELSMLLWALASLRLVPGKLWWEQFLQASYHKMTSQSPQVRVEVISIGSALRWCMGQLGGYIPVHLVSAQFPCAFLPAACALNTAYTCCCASLCCAEPGHLMHYMMGNLFLAVHVKFFSTCVLLAGWQHHCLGMLHFLIHADPCHHHLVTIITLAPSFGTTHNM
jgi:hypothetical protein